MILFYFRKLCVFSEKKNIFFLCLWINKEEKLDAEYFESREIFSVTYKMLHQRKKEIIYIFFTSYNIFLNMCVRNCIFDFSSKYFYFPIFTYFHENFRILDFDRFAWIRNYRKWKINFQKMFVWLFVFMWHKYFGHSILITNERNSLKL